MKPDRVAVIMPFKNSAGTILKSARSVVNQSDGYGREVTLFCVDDGSTDGSVDILKSIEPTKGNSIHMLIGDRNGPAGARNVALEYIRSLDYYNYVAFCDSDDEWFGWHLHRSIMSIHKYGVDMVYSDVECENERGEPLKIFGIPNPPEFDRKLLEQGNYIFISTVVMKIDVIDVGQFKDYAVPMEDWEYWLRVSDKYKIKHIQNPKPGAIYMWKSTGSYYTQEESQAAKQRILNKMNIQDPMNVEGWLSRAEGEFLAKNAEGRKCIEIGSYKGKSTNFIAPKAESIVCIDTFKADDGGQTQMVAPTTYVDFAKNTGHLTNVTPLIGMSQNVHPLLKNDDFDFIFIDGMHDYESVMNDVKNYLPKLKDGAVIMFHDYFQRDWPGVVRCVDELFGGPDELVDTVAKVTITSDRRFSLLMKFAGMEQQHKVEDDILFSDVTDFEPLCLSGRTIIIAPWSSPVIDNPENPKNFPYWKETVAMLSALGAHTVQIGRAGEKIIGCDEIRFNSTDSSLKELLNEADTFISVDSFFPHFAAFHQKKGVVIFAKSDPEIFGHPIHLNILKSRKYLRPDQFRWWRDVSFDKDAFVTANEVVRSVVGILNGTEIYTELSEKN